MIETGLTLASQPISMLYIVLEVSRDSFPFFQHSGRNGELQYPCQDIFSQNLPATTSRLFLPLSLWPAAVTDPYQSIQLVFYCEGLSQQSSLCTFFLPFCFLLLVISSLAVLDSQNLYWLQFLQHQSEDFGQVSNLFDLVLL